MMVQVSELSQECALSDAWTADYRDAHSDVMLKEVACQMTLKRDNLTRNDEGWFTVVSANNSQRGR
jgi:hypothetical protein